MIVMFMRLGVLLVFLAAASCSAELSEKDARQEAAEFARGKGWVIDQSLVMTSVTQTPREWVITYSGRGDVLGGPIVIGVEKEDRAARLIEGGQ